MRSVCTVAARFNGRRFASSTANGWLGCTSGRKNDQHRHPKAGENRTHGVRGRRSSGMLCGADHIGERRMDDEAEFADHMEMQEFAERNGLDYAWAGTALFEKRRRT